MSTIGRYIQSVCKEPLPIAEIVEFCRFLEPTAEEATMREAATERVRQAIVEVFPTASVQVFGSFVTGMPVTYASCCAVRAVSHVIVLCCA